MDTSPFQTLKTLAAATPTVRSTTNNYILARTLNNLAFTTVESLLLEFTNCSACTRTPLLPSVGVILHQHSLIHTVIKHGHNEDTKWFQSCLHHLFFVQFCHVYLECTQNIFLQIFSIGNLRLLFDLHWIACSVLGNGPVSDPSANPYNDGTWCLVPHPSTP
jgi:hypothetical protein